MREGIQGWLDDVRQTRGARDGAVDAAERGESEDFANVVTGNNSQKENQMFAGV